MPTENHHYLIEAIYGPADLLKALNKLIERHGKHPDAPDFDFDYIKRKIEISARSKETAEKLARELEASIEKNGAPGLLLVGKTTVDRDEQDNPLQGAKARARVPIGVLLQTPDVYVEVLVGGLTDFGVRGIQLEADGDGFAIPQTMINRRLDYEQFLSTFPLPPYLELKDLGEEGT